MTPAFRAAHACRNNLVSASQPKLLCPTISVEGNDEAIIHVGPFFTDYEGCSCQVLGWCFCNAMTVSCDSALLSLNRASVPQEGYHLHRTATSAGCISGVPLPEWVPGVVVVLFVLILGGAATIIYLLLKGRAEVLIRAAPPSAPLLMQSYARAAAPGWAPAACGCWQQGLQ